MINQTPEQTMIARQSHAPLTNTFHVIYVSTGDQNGFYTLRSKVFEPTQYGGYYRDHFIKNSSRTWEVALKQPTLDHNNPAEPKAELHSSGIECLF